MPDKTIVVLTAKSIDRILAEGGTSSWRLDRNNARQCDFAVCTRNAQADWVEGPEPHHSAFLVGRVKDVVPASEKGRYLVVFSEFARVNIPDVWKNDRNPLRYSTLTELGIDPSTLKWETMPQLVESPAVFTGVAPADKAGSYSLTLEEAKNGLARTFNVAPEAIEITIRA